MSRGRYSIKMLLATIIAGAIYSVIAEIFYQMAEDTVPGLVLIPVYFTGLFLVLGGTVLATGKMIYSRSAGSINKKQWLITFLLIVVLSVFFEFLYEIINDRKKTEEITAYLFVLDDSGSMEQNDPDRIRYQVIDTLLADKPDDFQYGIYSFNNEIKVLREMAPKSQKADYDYPEAEGGTRIRGALSEIVSDLDAGTLLLDEHSRIILLSDGYATDISFFSKNRVLKALKGLVKKGISVSTVGLSNADDTLMTMIADKTGGVYVKADDVSALEEAMNQAAVSQNTTRNLLGYRSAFFLNGLLGAMRIAFIAVLGIVIAVEKTILSERFLDTSAVMQSSAIGSILAGICIELGMNMLGVHPTIMRILTCILIAFTLLKNDLRNMYGEDYGVKYAGR